MRFFTQPEWKKGTAKEPNWEHAGRVHDWRNHVSDRIKSIWGTFSLEQREALIEQAEEQASAETWD